MVERKTRPDTEQKRDVILTKALDYAIQMGWENFKRDDFCNEIGIATGSINYHFKSMDGFKRAIMRKAVAKRIVPIVAQGIAMRCSVARAAPESLKKLAIAHMMAN